MCDRQNVRVCFVLLSDFSLKNAGHSCPSRQERVSEKSVEHIVSSANYVSLLVKVTIYRNKQLN